MPHISNRPIKPLKPVKIIKRHEPPTISDLNDKIKALQEFMETEFRWLRSRLSRVVNRSDLKNTEEKIMSAISDFLTKQEAFNTRQSSAIDSVVTSVDGLTADVAELNRQIKDLQDSSGGVTPEDQARIDALQAGGEALAAKLETVGTALQALDAATPPRPPSTPA